MYLCYSFALFRCAFRKINHRSWVLLLEYSLSEMNKYIVRQTSKSQQLTNMHPHPLKFSLSRTRFALFRNDHQKKNNNKKQNKTKNPNQTTTKKTNKKTNKKQTNKRKQKTPNEQTKNKTKQKKPPKLSSFS